MIILFKKSPVIVLMLCIGCRQHSAPSRLYIKLVNNGGSVEFRGLDAAILGEIQRDSIPNIWQTLIPVYRMPADTNLKDYQPPQPGKYEIQQNKVIFTPDTPFITGQSYFMRFYHFDEGKTVFDLIKNKRKLGSQPYSDLIFSCKRAVAN